jgi:hypothetical protein
MKNLIKLIISYFIPPLRYIVRSVRAPTIIDLIKYEATEESAKYIKDNFSDVMLFDSREDLWNLSLSIAKPGGLYAEFGVWSGYSINYFARKNKHQIFFGFDSFEGLAENWLGTNLLKGAFNLKGKMPIVESNVKLYKGWFSDSVPLFLEQEHSNFSFIHFDADTYESTSYLLKTIGNKICSGTVIVFDEYLGLPNWKNGEFRAWSEFVKDKSISYKYLGFSPNQAALVVL